LGHGGRTAVLEDGVRVFKPCERLGVGSGKMALSRPTHAAQYPEGASPLQGCRPAACANANRWAESKVCNLNKGA